MDANLKNILTRKRFSTIINMKGVSCLMFEKYQMTEMQESINFGMGVLNGKRGKPGVYGGMTL